MGRLAIVRCWWGETAELNYQLPIVNRQWSMGEAVRIGGDLECVVDGEAAVNGIRALRQKELQVRSLQAHHGVGVGMLWWGLGKRVPSPRSSFMLHFQ
jgi:hypothetical protein